MNTTNKILLQSFLGSLLVFTGSAYAGWTYTSLNPEGIDKSYAYSVDSIGEVGGYLYDGANVLPVYWSTPSASGYVDLSNNQQNQGNVKAIIPGRQAGVVQILNNFFGVYWSGSSDSMVTPSTGGYTSSSISSLSANWAGGYVSDGDELKGRHATIWNLSNNTMIDLNPSEYFSIVNAIAGANGGNPGVQAGSVRGITDAHVNAALWHGTAASYTSLAPANSFSTNVFALSPDGAYQGGYELIQTPNPLVQVSHAALWHGTADSFVDMHPTNFAGIVSSIIEGMIDGLQVGFVNGVDKQDQNFNYAFLWSGSADQYFNLQSVLPSNYTSSQAWGIARNGSTVYVAGFAINDAGNEEAILWTFVPEPGSLVLFLTGLGFIASRQRRVG